MDKTISEEALAQTTAMWASLAQGVAEAERTEDHEAYNFALGALCGFSVAMVQLGLFTIEEAEDVVNALKIIARQKVSEALRRLISLN